jgi:predicted ferric reductase
LCTFSIPWIRHRFYETFPHSHLLASIIYFGLLFWHTAQQLDSGSYLWATVVIWLFSPFGRLFIKLKTPRGAQATLEDIDEEGEMLKITIPAPRGLEWGVGSHVFLRFPTVAPLDNHPFTVASLCEATLVGNESGKMSRMPLFFLVRPRDGITGKSMKIARRQEAHSSTLKVLVEGPYVGLEGGLERRFEQVVLVAGGSGISAMLPLLMSLSRKIGERGSSVLKDVRLIWAVRNRNALSWMADELTTALESAPPKEP